MKLLIPCIVLASGVTILGAQAATGVPEGRVIAVEACSACHQVLPDQKPPPPVFDRDEDRNVPAPSFADIARKYRGKPRQLRAFITAPLHPMREQDWDRVDLDAVADYIGSLPLAIKRRGGR